MAEINGIKIKKVKKKNGKTQGIIVMDNHTIGRFYIINGVIEFSLNYNQKQISEFKTNEDFLFNIFDDYNLTINALKKDEENKIEFKRRAMSYCEYVEKNNIEMIYEPCTILVAELFKLRKKEMNLYICNSKQGKNLKINTLKEG